MSDLPPLADRDAYTMGSGLHSRYMVVNDAPIAHSEDKNKPLYDEAEGVLLSWLDTAPQDNQARQMLDEIQKLKVDSVIE